MSNEKQTSPMFQATSMMLEAMRDLKEKKISPQEANSIALLGKGITDMAREATNFVRATGMIPVDSAFGSTFRDIENLACVTPQEQGRQRYANDPLYRAQCLAALTLGRLNTQINEAIDPERKRKRIEKTWTTRRNRNV